MLTEHDKTQRAIEVFDLCASEYNLRFMDQSPFHQGFDIFLNYLPKGGAVFELACGPGNITRYLCRQRADLHILSSDLSEKMIELAKQNNPKAAFIKMDCRDILSRTGLFDGILCGFGLPYLNREDALKLISDCRLKLNENGVLYLSTMEGNYYDSGFKNSSTGKGKPAYIHYHQRDYLIETLTLNGFTEVYSAVSDYIEADGKISKDLVMVYKLCSIK